jgi:hypothetical protein
MQYKYTVRCFAANRTDSRQEHPRAWSIGAFTQSSSSHNAPTILRVKFKQSKQPAMLATVMPQHLPSVCQAGTFDRKAGASTQQQHNAARAINHKHTHHQWGLLVNKVIIQSL